MTSTEFGRTLNKDSDVTFEAPDPSGPKALNVALFPYTPEPLWFEAAVTAAWEKLKTGITLKFVPYNCYAEDPADTHDVFAYDCIFADFMQKFCLPIYIDGIDDFYPWSLASLTKGPYYSGIPYLGCMQILIRRTSDNDLNRPDLSIDILNKIVGNAVPTTVWPPPAPQPGRGMLLDLTGGSTVACAYEQAVMEGLGDFPLRPKLAPCPGLDPDGLAHMVVLRRTAGYAQATYNDESGHDRMDKWNSGVGRAYMGLTENFHSISDVPASSFSVMPLSSRPLNQTGVPMYADAISVNAKLEKSKQDNAARLANLIASTPVLLEAMAPAGRKPQYLVPTRRSLMEMLLGTDPTGGVYNQINAIISSSRAVPFRLGPDSRDWLTKYKACIRQTILGPAPAGAVTAPEFDEELMRVPTYASTPGGLNRRP